MAIVDPVVTTRDRAKERKGYPVPIHFELIDKDIDLLAISQAADTAAIHRKLDRLNARALGVLGSLMTTSLLLIVDLVRH
jgi:hypothetical protein